MLHDPTSMLGSPSARARRRRRTLSFLFALFCVISAAQAQLSGTYTVGGSGASYNAIEDAIAAVQSSGVSGAVTFLINGGTYTPPSGGYTLSAVATMSASNTVTFRPANGATVVIDGNISSPIFNISGGDYFILDGANSTGGSTRNWKVINRGSSQVIKFVNGATYNTVRNMNLIGNATSNSVGIINFSSSTSANGGNSYNAVSSNTLGDSAGTLRSTTGIYSSGTTGASTTNVANRIENNDIINYGNGSSTAYGVWTAAGNQQVKILGNRIRNSIKTGSNGDMEGVRFDNNSDNYLDTIAYNRIWDISTTSATATLRGITVWYQSASSSLVIHNNMVSVIANDGTLGGVYIDPTVAAPTYLYHNSIYVGGTNTTASTTSRVVWVSTSAAVTARDNILVNERSSTGTNTNRVIDMSSATNTSSFSYNVLYAAGSSTTIGYAGSTAYQTMSAWQGTGRDANSFYGNPRFVSPTTGDLHISTTRRTPVESRGTPIAGITTDIDGNTRSTVAPDAGADEGNFLGLLSDDVEALALIAPVNGALVRNGTSYSPTGSVINSGTTAETNVAVRLRIVDQSTGTVVYEDVATLPTLAVSGGPQTVTFNASGSVTGTIGSLADGSYRAQMFVELGADGDRTNDTVTASFVVKGPLSGTYTINPAGSGSRNYASFTAALSDLNQLGVSAAVTFQVAGGTYGGAETLPLRLAPIAGASATNTVTFTPASGATPVIDGNVATQIILFDGADYVVFDGANSTGGSTRNWKVINRGSGQVIKFVNGATYNTVRNMNLIGNATSNSVGIINFSSSTSANGGNSYNAVSSNTLGDSAGTLRSTTGIYSSGTTGASTTNVANRIENNDIINYGNGSSTAYGVWTAAGNQQVKILGNRIRNSIKTGSSGDMEGVRFDNNSDNYLDTIAYNRIWDISTTSTTATLRGINVWYLSASSSLTIQNNMVSVIANDGTLGGVYIDPTAAASVNLYYNSIYIGGSNSAASTTSRAVWVSTNALITARNNILVNERSSTGTSTNRVIDMSSATNTSTFDYNILWASGSSTTIGYAGSAYTTLSAWQGTGRDAHSFTGSVPFISTAGGDLHVNPAPVFKGESSATPLAGIGDDFDRTTRDASRPDIGADEGNFNGGGIRVLYPNGGESFAVNYQLTMTFTTNRPLPVRIEFSPDGGATWVQKGTVSPTVSGTNTVTVTTPNTVTNQALVRVISQSNTNEADTSDATFSLVNPVIVLGSPNGGERWVGGDTNKITWTSEFMPPAMTLNVEYSTDGGSTWRAVKNAIASNNLPGSNTIDWVVPNTPTTQGKVRVYIPGSLSGDTSATTFTIIEQPRVTILAPTGGERWFVGEKNTIRWTSATTDFVNLEYSTNGGSTWTEIAHRVPADLGGFDWTLPNTPSTTAMVRISSYERPRYFGQSQSFSILKSTLTVLAPNGGEKYELNQPVTVTWSAQSVTKLRVEYSSNNGGTWQVVGSGVPAATGTFTFTPPQVPTTRGLVRIVDEDRPSSVDISDAPFEVMEATSITIYSPAAGDEYARNSVTAIVWSAPRMAAVNIFYSSNGGATWQTVATNVDAAQGSYIWSVPGVNTTQGKIRIANAAGGLTAESGIFSIIDPVVPTLRVIAPNGGESFTEGDNVAILWSASAVQGALTISYSSNSGATWTTIASNVPASAGQYGWTAPSAPGSNYRISIAAANVTDASDADFTVVKRLAPKIQVLAPNGGESLTIGTQQAITWSAEDVFDSFTVQYSTDNGSNWKDIGTAPANASGAGNYSLNWTVPSEKSTTVLVRVRSNAAGDVSDAVFQIVEPVKEPIRVTSPNGGELWVSREDRQITWQAPADVVNVRIEISLDGGNAWSDVIASTPNDGSHPWKVQDVASIVGTAVIRVSDAADATRSDISDAPFQISPATSGVQAVAGSSGMLSLEGNFPNPFASSTELRWSQPAPAEVALRIYRADGALAGTVAIGIREAGRQRYTVDAGDLAAGVYRYELVIGGRTLSGSMILVR